MKRTGTICTFGRGRAVEIRYLGSIFAESFDAIEVNLQAGSFVSFRPFCGVVRQDQTYGYSPWYAS